MLCYKHDANLLFFPDIHKLFAIFNYFNSGAIKFVFYLFGGLEEKQ